MPWELRCWTGSGSFNELEDSDPEGYPKFNDGSEPSPLTLLKEFSTIVNIEEKTWETRIPWDKRDDVSYVKNLWISPRFNYQDGWWVRDEATKKWTEIDKPVDNQCYLDSECTPLDGVERCCSNYPDNNNRRCMPKANNLVE